jgi:peptide-methionine (R)-S-oxide reductase
MTQTKIDRRALFGLAAATGASMLLFGRSQSAAANVRFTVNHPDGEWRRLLGPQRYHILREGGTERSFTSPLLNEHRRGTFVCAGCALPLFSSTTKFDSGTGWPSFWRPLAHAVLERPDPYDHYFGLPPTEVACARCGGHLGHVFRDGPKPTGLRYCIDGLALNFRAA